MASDAVQIEAGGRSVRVSSPTRVIYEATDFSAEVTKAMVAEYYVAVADGNSTRVLSTNGGAPFIMRFW